MARRRSERIWRRLCRQGDQVGFIGPQRTLTERWRLARTNRHCRFIQAAIRARRVESGLQDGWQLERREELLGERLHEHRQRGNPVRLQRQELDGVRVPAPFRA